MVLVHGGNAMMRGNMSKYIIHVGLYNTSNDIDAPAKGGYVYSRTTLTQDINKAKHFNTEDEADEFDLVYENVMCECILEVKE